MRNILMASAAVIALASVGGSLAYAQSPNAASSPNVTSNPVSTPTVSADLRNMLQNSGYTDIRISPTSFMVRATDTHGNPVVMAVSPDSFTAVTDVTTGSGSSTQPANAATGAGRFVSLAPRDDLSSKIVGLDIYNADKKDIGQIKDIALNQSGQIQAYILSVGGFLGIGEHYVAVRPSAVTVTYNDSAKKWTASMNATSDQLKAAPEFKYTGRWSAS